MTESSEAPENEKPPEYEKSRSLRKSGKGEPVKRVRHLPEGIVPLGQKAPHGIGNALFPEPSVISNIPEDQKKVPESFSSQGKNT
jgi:UTP-glucose-1-phosphate uridylyltransferase